MHFFLPWAREHLRGLWFCPDAHLTETTVIGAAGTRLKSPPGTRADHQSARVIPFSSHTPSPLKNDSEYQHSLDTSDVGATWDEAT